MSWPTLPVGVSEGWSPLSVLSGLGRDPGKGEQLLQGFAGVSPEAVLGLGANQKAEEHFQVLDFSGQHSPWQGLGVGQQLPGKVWELSWVRDTPKM